MIHFKRFLSLSSRESEDDLSKELSVLMTAYRDAPTKCQITDFKSVCLQILPFFVLIYYIVN